MSDVAIACEGVWKSYRIYHQRSHTLKEKILSRRNLYEDFWALRGVDLEVKTGGTTGIIGANGSGKSTLLKTMARILTPNRGSVRVNGTVSPLLELGTGFHPELTGRENVYLGGSLLGHTRRDIDARYDGIAEFAGIQDFMDIPVKNYSSGMYARLAFAVASSADPDILIVDEVLAVGDESFQMRCYERISDLRADGRTIVLVSHSLPTIRSMCSRVIWLDHGAVRETGTAADVVASYLTDVHNAQAEKPLEPVAKGKRYGTGEAAITDVTFLDADGAPATRFRTGDRMTVRMTYRTRGVIDSMTCGIAVFRSDNLAHVFTQSTVEDDLEFNLQGEGVVEFTMPSLPLLAGDYVITLALHDKPVHRIYDCHELRHSFSVSTNPKLPLAGGLVHVDSEWKVSPSAVRV